jgi:hypothetical protein
MYVCAIEENGTGRICMYYIHDFGMFRIGLGAINILFNTIKLRINLL